MVLKSTLTFNIIRIQLKSKSTGQDPVHAVKALEPLDGLDVSMLRKVFSHFKRLNKLLKRTKRREREFAEETSHVNSILNDSVIDSPNTFASPRLCVKMPASLL